MLRDKAARFHVASLIHEHKIGALESKGYTAICMDRTLENGDAHPTPRTTVKTPDFALSEPYHWDQAIEMLKNGKILLLPAIQPVIPAAKKWIQFPAQFPAVVQSQRFLVNRKRTFAVYEGSDTDPEFYPKLGA